MYKETDADLRVYSQEVNIQTSLREPIDPKYLFKDLEDLVNNEYPQLLLPDPLFFSETRYLDVMTYYELQIAYLLHGKGFAVYREPKIKGFRDIVPDFFVYNPFVKMGKLLEITYMGEDGSNCSEKTKVRKLKQKDNLTRCGIPFTILYRDDLDRIFANNYIDIV